jgi:aminoglycoside phosphotransferase (APT) family kinase protein
MTVISRSEWKDRVETYLEKFYSSKIIISGWEELSGGACQDNIAFVATKKSEKETESISVVLRTDKSASLLSSLPKFSEFEVATEIYKTGAKIPKPILYEKDTSILGSPFYLMERIQGNANSRFLIKDPSLNLYRKNGLAKDLAMNLTKIHSILPRDPNLGFSKETFELLGKTNPREYLESSIESLRTTIQGISEPHPAIEIALNWLEKNYESFLCDELVLVHGDFRTGNFMVSSDGLHGILDFEFAHWGDPSEDIAWLCLRDWRFGKIQKEVGGFADRKEFYDHYQVYSGRTVEPDRIRFWEIVGNLRWAIGSIQQAERHLSGKDTGIELAAIGRRTSEMEFEMIRLLKEFG